MAGRAAGVVKCKGVGVGVAVPGTLYKSILAGSSFGTRLEATYAIDWPLRANEWRVAAVGRSKNLL